MGGVGFTTGSCGDQVGGAEQAGAAVAANIAAANVAASPQERQEDDNDDSMGTSCAMRSGGASPSRKTRVGYPTQMRCAVPFAVLSVLAACGGGGGGGGAPATTPTRLSAAALDLGPATTEAELAVQLAATPAQPPVLLEVAVELPAGLTLASGNPLVATQSTPTLDGGTVGGRYVVVCGDAKNKAATPLQPGPLFRVRVQTTTPRQTGTYSITLRNLRASNSDGSAAAVDPNPTIVSVTVR